MPAYKQIQRQTTVSAAIADAISELQSLGEECREAYDNAPESLQQTERNQAMETAADALDSLEEPDITDAVADLTITYSESISTRKGRSPSRATRCSNATAMLSAAINTIETSIENLEKHKRDEDDDSQSTDDEIADRITDLEQLRDSIQEIIDEADGLEFPGMRG